MNSSYPRTIDISAEPVGTAVSGVRVAKPRRAVRKKPVSAQRVHLGLAMVYGLLIFVALCWSVSAMAVFSKLFVSAVFAIALYALGQSIPSKAQSFVISGAIFLAIVGAVTLLFAG